MVPDDDGQDTVMMRALSAVTTPAPTHIGKTTQVGGLACIALVMWHGIAPSFHQLAHPGEPGIDAWPLWAILLVLAAGIVLLAGAETLANGVRAVLPFFGKGS
jgi:hypothetical protein